MKGSAERPWDCGASHGHTMTVLSETISQGGYFWHALDVLHITFLYLVNVTMMIGKFIRKARGGGVRDFLGRHRSKVHHSQIQFLASTTQSLSGSSESGDKYLGHK